MWRWRTQDAKSGGTPRSRIGATALCSASMHTYSEMAHAWRVTFNDCGVRTAQPGGGACVPKRGCEISRKRRSADLRNMVPLPFARRFPPVRTSTVARMMRNM
jgi:hypothetical protein